MTDQLMRLLIRAYFTKMSLAIHAVLYPTLMVTEGGDYHLFLDGISIEAVFVGLMVGISTKAIHDRQHHLHGLIHRLANVRRDSGDTLGLTTTDPEGHSW